MAIPSEQLPLVSVLVPVYNGGAFLREALESIRIQTYDNLEIIVRDNCSTDDSAAIAESFAAEDDRFTVIRSEENIGGLANYIDLLTRATADYVKYCNADDVLEPDCVRVLVSAMVADPSITLATSVRILIDEQGNELPPQGYSTPVSTENVVLGGVEASRFALVNHVNFIGEPTTTLFRNGLFEAAEIFRYGSVPQRKVTDLAAWLNLLSRGNLYYHVTPLSRFRLHAGQDSRDDTTVLWGTLDFGLLIAAAAEKGVFDDPQLFESARAGVQSWLSVQRAALSVSTGEVERAFLPRFDEVIAQIAAPRLRQLQLARRQPAPALKFGVVLLSTRGVEEANGVLAGLAKHGSLAVDDEVVVALGGASTELGEVTLEDPATAAIVQEPDETLPQLWSRAIQQTSADWLLLITDDIRLKEGWLAPISERIAADRNIYAVSPSLLARSGPASSAAPALGDGVCLIASRAGLLGTATGTAVLVKESVVTVLAPPLTGPASSALTLGVPAPGGGAPSGPVQLLDNPVHAGASYEDSQRRLHLGCGTNHIRGWLNVDGDALGRPDMVVDLRDGMPFPDNSVDLIYSEHFFEHLTLEQGLVLFAECYRVLTPGGVLRTAMPNLRDIVRTYASDNWREGHLVGLMPGLDSAARAFNMAMREWGHSYLYDIDDLTLRLMQTGFVDIVAPALGESERPALRGLETRPDSSLVAEARKPGIDR